MIDRSVFVHAVFVEPGHNISIPAAVQTAGWRTVLKGTTGDFSRWSDANTAAHRFFKVVVEQN